MAMMGSTSTTTHRKKRSVTLLFVLTWCCGVVPFKSHAFFCVAPAPDRRRQRATSARRWARREDRTETVLEEEVDLETLWRAHSRPLLRLGSKGVRDSHRRSLVELLAAHSYVAVKFNGCASPDDVDDVARSLRPDDAAILLTKGTTVLFGATQHDDDEDDQAGVLPSDESS